MRNTIISRVFVMLAILLVAVTAGYQDGKNGTSKATALKGIDVGWGTVDVGVGLRLRYEYFTNRSLRKYGSQTNDDLLIDKTDFSVRYSSPVGLALYAEGYSAHMWLNEFGPRDFLPTSSYQNNLDVKQLHLEMRSIGGSSLGFRAGRQILSYGDDRILGPGAWNNCVKYTWDAAVFRVDVPQLCLDAIYGRRLLTEPFVLDMQHFDFHMGGFYASVKQLPARLDLFALGMLNPEDTTKGELHTGKVRLATAGVHSRGDVGNVHLATTLAGQCGHYGGSRALAGGANVSCSYGFTFSTKPCFGLGYTYASGDPDPTDGIVNTFDGAFGSAAKYYGRMNLFYWKNLHDIEANLDFAPVKKTALTLSYHHLRLAQAKDAWYKTNGSVWSVGKQPCHDQSGLSGTELGHEFDLIASASILPGVRLLSGYGHFIAGRFVSGFIHAERKDSDWLFAQVEYTL